jgi:hypothetical protein
MSDTKTETGHHQEAVVVELPKGPTVNENGVMIYPTSFIPTKAHMDASRIPTEMISGLQIEVIHVIIFLILTFGLFYSMWKRPNVR